MATGVERRGPRRIVPRQNGDTRDHALVTVVLSGDPSSSLAGVRFGLERHGINVLAEAANGDEAVEAALRHQPQVCLLDVDMPGGGIAAAHRISADLPGTKI